MLFFRYNCVSLGLVAAAVACIVSQCELIGSALFSLALNYKQMSLYHQQNIIENWKGILMRNTDRLSWQLFRYYAPAFFTYLLAKNLSRRNVYETRPVSLLYVIFTSLSQCWKFCENRNNWARCACNVCSLLVTIPALVKKRPSRIPLSLNLFFFGF